VVTPAYNEQTNLARVAASIIAQTVKIASEMGAQIYADSTKIVATRRSDLATHGGALEMLALVPRNSGSVLGTRL